MQRPPIPEDEEERIAALASCGILDTEQEAAFDDIAQLASALCGVPIALVSMVDRSRQWFKARVGLAVTESPRDFSFCGHAVARKEPLVIRDVLEDARFFDNPLVLGDPHIRFYAGIPLVLEEDGHAVGTLCVIDRVPRELSAAQLSSLTALAKRVSTELSLRRRLAATRWSAPPDAPTLSSTAPTVSDGSRTQPVSPLPVGLGAVLGDRYRIERVLGAGGMGVVAAARDLTSARPVAIKFMLPAALAQPQAVRRFVREAQALLAIRSEHVAQVLDVGNLGSGVPFIVMEYLEGRDLAARLAAEGPLPLIDAVSLAREACCAIADAHACNILHRDLKPANLFEARRPDGSSVLKVLDFGISKLAATDAAAGQTALTGVAASLGSPHYMSPEQMLGAAGVDARTDVYSLGVVLYELLAGEPPFDGANMVEICAKVLSQHARPLASIRADVPPVLAALIERCMQKDRAQRYPTASALAEELEWVEAVLR